MIKIGKGNYLKVLRLASVGAYLDAGDLGEILLPTREMPEDLQVDDEVEVFISYDSEDRLVATRRFPIAMVDDFALLKVIALETVGAFLDWGMDKDLLLPFGEQTREVQIGQDVVVHIGLDKSQRISASMRLDRYAATDMDAFEPGQKVDLLIAGQSELGYKAVIDGSHVGLLYKNEVFQPLSYGQRLRGFIKTLRPDGKIDLSLQEPDGRQMLDGTAQKILAHIRKQSGGFAPINDKTEADEIYRLFGVSKKKYKIALGGLYKRRVIRVTTEGVYLVPEHEN